MIQFAQPQYLLLIFLIPLLFIANGFKNRARKRRIDRLGERRLVLDLMPALSFARNWIKLSLFSVAFLFFVVGLARPQLGARVKEIEGKGAEIVIALDLSNSMLAQDFTPNRLERAKLAVMRLTDRMVHDRIGLVVFAGEAFVQVPITTDYVSAKMFLNSLSTNSVSVQGTSLAAAIRRSMATFSGESGVGKAIILITDGEDHEEEALEAAKDAKELDISIFTVGIGSTEGKPIPLPSGDLLHDKEGNIVITKLNDQLLAEIANIGGGHYVRATNSDFGLNPIFDEIKNIEREQYKAVVFEDFNEQFFYFFAIALLLFILEMVILERKGRLFFK
ncbi:MAG: VWA domain-containing protein [Bacteroidales bacterium]